MDKRVIIWTLSSTKGLKTIFSYYNSRNRSNTYSRKLYEEMTLLMNKIAQFPFIGKMTDKENIRYAVVKEYLLFYQINDNDISVLKVWNSRRNPTERPYE